MGKPLLALNALNDVFPNKKIISFPFGIVFCKGSNQPSIDAYQNWKITWDKIYDWPKGAEFEEKNCMTNE